VGIELFLDRSVDLGFLSLFTQRFARLSGGMWRNQRFEAQQWRGSKGGQNRAFPRWKKAIYMGPQNLPVVENLLSWTCLENVGRADTLDKCTLKGHLSVSTFLIYNDMTMFRVN
jgi:hypothetical protein